MTIKTKGDTIENFKLEDQNGEEVELAKIEEFALLSFHSLAFTSVCLDQMRDLEVAYDDLFEKGVRAFGLSVDAQPTKSAWAKFACLDKLQILADFKPHGQVAKDCGVFNEDMNTSGRSNLIVNNKGEVLWSKDYDLGTKPDLEEVFEAIESL